MLGKQGFTIGEIIDDEIPSSDNEKTEESDVPGEITESSSQEETVSEPYVKVQQDPKQHTRKDEMVCDVCGKPISSNTSFVLPDGKYIHVVCSGLTKKDWQKALAFTDKKFSKGSLRIADITCVKDWEKKVKITNGFRDNEGNDSQELACLIGEDHGECVERLKSEGWNCSVDNSSFGVDQEGNPILKPK
jgi:hypothetical protein